jgi:hypothetical protein
MPSCWLRTWRCRFLCCNVMPKWITSMKQALTSLTHKLPIGGQRVYHLGSNIEYFFYPPLDLDIYHSYILGVACSGHIRNIENGWTFVVYVEWGTLPSGNFFGLKGAGTLCWRCIDILGNPCCCSYLVCSIQFNFLFLSSGWCACGCWFTVALSKDLTCQLSYWKFS